MARRLTWSSNKTKVLCGVVRGDAVERVYTLASSERRFLKGLMYLAYDTVRDVRWGSHYRRPFLCFLELSGSAPASIISALSVREELSSLIVSMDSTGLPPMRRMGSSVAFVRRKSSGVMTPASAKEID